MTQIMQALWLENNQLTYKTDVPIQHPLAKQALVRVRLAGICTTVLDLINGYYPYTRILCH
jgi:threonine dehydrogenase-like Zn-dependent dehydrogenase